MKLIEAFDPKDFKNPLVANVVKSLSELEDQFTNRGKGNSLGGHLLGLAQDFREEESAIMSLFEKVQGAEKKKKKENPIQKVKFIQANTNTASFSASDDCIDCDKSLIEDQHLSQPAKNRKIIKEGGTVEEPKEATIEDAIKAKSFREIMNLFNGSADEMIQFSKTIGISIGNTKAPDKLAKKIYTYLQDESFSE